MKKVSNQIELNAAIEAGEKEVEIIGQWEKVIIKEDAKLDSVYVYGTVEGSVYVSGTVEGSVYVSGTAKVGSVYVSGTAKVGSVYVYGTVEGSVDVYGTVEGSVYEKLKLKKIAGFTFQEIEADHRKILEAAKDEVPFLLKAIEEGKINGHLYEGDCVCLVGTLEKARGKGNGCVVERKQLRPAEKFYMAISTGHTPANNSYSRFAAKWCRDFLAENK